MTDELIDLSSAERLATQFFKKDYQRIERGLNNWVFESDELILTIPRHKRVKDYSLRVSATNKLHSEGIPVARIIDYHPKNGTVPEYLVVEKLKGEHARLEKKTSRERDSIHRSSGEILKAIHQVPGEAYGRFDSILKGTFDSWGDFVQWFLSDSMGRLRKVPQLWQRYAERLFAEYENISPLIEDFSDPSFLHADYHINNLLFSNNKVLAVLDLDIITSGDINWDTGHYCHTFNIDRENGVKSFQRGYGEGRNPLLERFYCLGIWARKLGSQGQDRPDALRETIPELNLILEND